MVAALAAAFVFSSPGTVLVLNKAEDTIWLISSATGLAQAKLSTGPNPNEVAVSPDGSLAAISDMGGGGRPPGSTITLVDIPARKVAKTISIDPHRAPHGIVWLNSDRLVFTSHATDSLNELDVKTGSIIRSIPTGQKGTHLAVVTKDQSTAFAVNAVSGSVTVIDLKAGKAASQIPTGARAEGISLSPDDKLVACGNIGANSVSIIDAKAKKVVHTIEGVGGPIRTLFTRDGRHLAVSSITSGSLEIFSTADWSKTATIPLKDKPVADAAYGQQWPVPMNLALGSDGSMYVVLVTSHAIAQIDTKTWKVTRTLQTGGLPDGLAIADA